MRVKILLVSFMVMGLATSAALAHSIESGAGWSISKPDMHSVPDSITQAQIDQANTWIVEAQQSRRSGEYGQAEELLGRAVGIVEQSDDWTINYRYYVENGQLNRMLGRHEEAERSFMQLFEIFNEDEHIRYIAVNYSNLAAVYTSAGEYDQAMEALENSLEYRLKVPEDSVGLAVTYKIKGEVHRVLRQYGDAYSAYSKSLEYLSDVGNPLLEADVSYAMGSLQNILGLQDSAKLYFDRVLELGTEQESPTLRVRAYSGLAEYYRATDQPRRSRENWINAIDITQGARQPIVIGLYLSALHMSVALYEQDGAEHWLEPAEDWISALEEMIEEYGSPRDHGKFNFIKADYHHAMGRYADAEADYIAALDIYEQIPRYRIQPSLYWSRAFNMMELNPDLGIELAEQAILLTNTYRQQVNFSGDLRAGYFKNLSPYYARLAQLYIDGDAQKPADAFRVLELNKSRVFAEDLYLNPASTEDFLEDAQLQRYKQLRSEIIDLETSSLNLEDPREQVKTLWEVEKLTREAERIYSEMLGKNEELRQFLAPPVISLAQAQAQLQPGEAGLQLGVYNNQIAAVLFTKEETSSWLTELPGTQVGAFVDELRGLIINRSPLEELKPRLESAGERLFPPAARRLLAKSEHLNIATDGILAYLPFDALRLNGRYITEQLSIRYTPSFSVQKALKQRTPDRNSESSSEPRALALTSPDYGSYELLPSYLRDEKNTLRPLPYANLEGRWIQENFYGETTLLTGSEATRERLLAEISENYEVLHFATHGILDERSPQLSGIVLARSDRQEVSETPATDAIGKTTRGDAISYPDDNFLRMGRIYELSLSSDLVILSACNTGIGKLVDGEGVLGFKRAFMFAGAHSVAVSLWSVQDRSTALLMRSFYENISEMKQPDEQLSTLEYAKALQQARRALIRQPGYSHPVYWAAFTITGN